MKLLLVLSLFLSAPDTLRLESCYREAEAHAPLRRAMALQTAITERKVENLDARYLPALALGGQAVYHSEVPALPLSLPAAAMPSISRDQYRVSVSVDQLIYDGGMIRQQKVLEHLQRDLAHREIEVELYRLREQVDAAFFGALLQEAQTALLRTYESDLQARLAQARSRVRGGVALGAHADVLAAELVRVEQQQAEAAARRRAALDVLAELIGRPVAEDAVLVVPAAAIGEVAADTRRRPEYEVFELNRSRLAQQEELAARKNRPLVSGFAEAAYGRPPGLNLFENELRPFYSVGVRVRWPFWDWHASRREREVLALQQQVVDVQEETFTRNIALAVQQVRRDIERLQELLRRDEEIIALRQRIVAQAASQLDGGVITATDYLIERNAEHQARLTHELHRLQLVQARVQYLTTLGGE